MRYKRAAAPCERLGGEDHPLDLSQFHRNKTENARLPDIKRIRISEIGAVKQLDYIIY